MALVVIQAGHAGRSRGATGTAGEQSFTTAVAPMAARAVTARGHRALVIQADEPDRLYRGDLFVAIHADGSSSASRRGACAGWRNDRGRQLAEAWRDAYLAEAKAAGYPLVYGRDNYTENLARYYGTGKALAQNPACHAIILEAGYLTNRDDRRWLESAAGRVAVADSIGDAVVSLLGNHPSRKPPTDRTAGRPGAQLRVDGVLGPNTIRAWQRKLGTPADGVISTPSTLVRAVQRHLNAARARCSHGDELRTDGLGIKQGNGYRSHTIEALQVYLRTPVDGRLSARSDAVMALQRRLNDGWF